MPEVIFGIIAIAATALYIREYAARRRIEEKSKPQVEDKAEYLTVAELTDKSRQLVSEAEKNAQRLVDEASELDSKTTQDFSQKLNAFLEEEKKQTEQAQSQVALEIKSEEEKFDQFIKDLNKVLENKTDAATNNFNAYLETLKIEAQKTQTANWEGARARVGQLFENFETKLADFLLQTEQKMMLSVDLELKSARQLIDTYKVQQMNIIDENIVAMLEKTLSLVLSKNLSLKDQMDLVYESLEKAKTESFLV
jgi:vacuolar-type H+-ATPase subunit H